MDYYNVLDSDLPLCEAIRHAPAGSKGKYRGGMFLPASQSGGGGGKSAPTAAPKPRTGGKPSGTTSGGRLAPRPAGGGGGGPGKGENGGGSGDGGDDDDDELEHLPRLYFYSDKGQYLKNSLLQGSEYLGSSAALSVRGEPLDRPGEYEHPTWMDRKKRLAYSYFKAKDPVTGRSRMITVRDFAPARHILTAISFPKGKGAEVLWQWLVPAVNRRSSFTTEDINLADLPLLTEVA